MINKVFGKLYTKVDGNPRLERVWLLSKIDFKKRYNDTTLGLIWAVVNPLFRAGIYYFAFTVIRDSNVDNFALYLLSGLLTWLFFSQSSKQSMIIFKRSKYLIENIRFKQLDLFYSSLLSTFYGFLFSVLAYFVLSLSVNIIPTISLLYLPFWLLILAVTILGVNLILATISIFFTDINQLWDLIIMAGFWTSPILFTAEDISNTAPWLLYVNPISGLIINIRNAIFYNIPPDWSMGLFNISYSVLLLLIGLVLFKKYSYSAIEKI